MKNNYAVWGKPNTPLPPIGGHGEHSAAHRLTTGGYCYIAHHPRFSFPKTASFFTIGSCFATNIANSLSNMGRQVLSRNISLDSKYFTEDVYSDDIALIKFTPHSFLNEIETNLLNKEYLDHGLIALNNNMYWNPQLHKIKPTSLENNLIIKREVKKCVSQISNADVIFVTLGLTETWFDKKLNIALNENPYRIKELHGSEFKDRFEFRNLDFYEALDTAERAISIIKETSTKDVRFIVTVSPVPLLRTFEDHDVITANTYSKGLLRTVAQTLYHKFDNVDYFPSYEMVLNSPRDLAWRHNQRHVEPGMVQHIMDVFLKCYLR